MKYIELLPQQLANLIASGSSAILPLGALEWHGAHLPLGLDGLVAEAFCERLAGESNAVLLPTLYAPITTLPHQFSLQIETSTFRSLMKSSVDGLVDAGFKSIALVTGHYAHGHVLELYAVAGQAMESHSELLVFAASPLEPLGDETLLDHAAHSEASQLMAIRPDLVRLENVESLEPRKSAILGADPRGATVEEGERLLRAAVDAWARWLEESDKESLDEFYRRRVASYQGYVDRYYEGSWEEAILKWWESAD